ncbi:MAG: hypothetical protein ACJ8AQ_11565, partial [Gemmatimonadales bacterium]
CKAGQPKRCMVALLVGALLAIGVGLLGTSTGLDRDRAFYPMATIVIAFLYALFAVMGGSSHALALEVLAGLGFLAAAVAGFKSSLWLVAGALVAHGIFDFVHGSVIANPGVPSWYPQFCLTFDLTLAAYLGWLLVTKRRSASAMG